MCLKIKENAIFIADAHYPHYGDDFLKILISIREGKIKTPQLFLMGDIFNLLFGYNSYIKNLYKKEIELLNSLNIEIFYFEGNHDFTLKKLFPNIRVYSRREQPVLFELNSKKVALSHGDKYEVSLGYNIYSFIIRNPITLFLLRPFEKKIINYQLENLSKKDICKEFKEFNKRVEKIKIKYTTDLIIEAHFHQGVIKENYISLPSLVCQKSIAIIKNQKVVLFKNWG